MLGIVKTKHRLANTMKKLLLLMASLLYSTLHFHVVAQELEFELTREFKQEITSLIAQLMEDEYIIPEKGVIAANEIRNRFESGFYDEIDTLQVFANRLTGTLDIIEDWHLWVNYYAEPIREDYIVRQPTPEEAREQADLLRRRNYGFEKVQRLVGNIGYIEYRDFYYEEESAENALSAAMELVKNTDGLIIELSGGGSPDMVNLFISYLIEEKTHVGSLRYRKNNETVEYWTLDQVNGPKYSEDKPIYLVISKSTFSAAEAFAYALQSLDRVTVVGEKTNGGAHASNTMRLHDHLMISMPVATSIDPRTRGNWQYVGIQPDHQVASEVALDSAYRLMLQELIASSDDTVARFEKEYALGQLDQQ